MGRPRELSDAAWPQVPTGSALLIVPVGSIEQHGPHLPLDTDTRIAVAVAAAIAGRRADAVLAPAIGYGASGEHEGFPGTVSLGTAALTAVLTEIGRSAGRWAPRLVFVNGHGGNVEALRAAVGLLRAESRDAAWFSCTVAGSDAHAGHTETSVLLALCPQCVGSLDGVRGNTAPLSDLMPALRAGGVAAVSDSGVLGDPGNASAAAGEAALAAMVDDGWSRLDRWAPDAGGMLL